MRKLSFFILLATAAAPALAQAGDDRRGRDRANASSEQSETRKQRAESRRSEARERRAAESRGSEAREQRQYGAQRSERNQANQQGSTERIREHVLQQRLQRQQAASNRSGNDGDVRTRRGSDGVSGQAQTNWRDRERRVRTIPDTRPTTTQRSTSQREAFQGRNHRDYRDGNYRRWSHDWRNDRRYDWRRHRDRNRSSFRIGFYYDPFGYNYRRWSIGSRLNSGYYRSNYWLNDPWQYRLPPAYGPYRWVRYWNDALLVNIYTGEVVEVMHGFFW